MGNLILPQKSMPLSTAIPDTLCQDIMLISVIFVQIKLETYLYTQKLPPNVHFPCIFCQFGCTDLEF